MHKIAYDLGHKVALVCMEKVARYSSFADSFMNDLRKKNPEMADKYFDRMDYPAFDFNDPALWDQFIKDIGPYHDDYYSADVQSRIQDRLKEYEKFKEYPKNMTWGDHVDADGALKGTLNKMLIGENMYHGKSPEDIISEEEDYLSKIKDVNEMYKPEYY